jgi:hypothetical protein
VAKQQTLDHTHALIARLPLWPVIQILTEGGCSKEAEWYVNNAHTFRNDNSGPFKSADKAHTISRRLEAHIWNVNSMGSEITAAGYNESNAFGWELKDRIERVCRGDMTPSEAFESHEASRTALYNTGSKHRDPEIREALLMRQALWREYGAGMLKATLPDDLHAIHIPALGCSLILMDNVYDGENPLTYLRALTVGRPVDSGIWVMASRDWPVVAKALQTLNKMPVEMSRLLEPEFPGNLSRVHELMYRYKRHRITDGDTLMYPGYIKDLDADLLPPYKPTKAIFRESDAP